MTAKEAMNSAKKSFSRDIDAGFKIIHIDTSLSLKDTEKSKKKCLDRLFEMYEFCFNYAKKKKIKKFTLKLELKNKVEQQIHKKN